MYVAFILCPKGELTEINITCTYYFKTKDLKLNYNFNRSNRHFCSSCCCCSLSCPSSSLFWPYNMHINIII